MTVLRELTVESLEVFVSVKHQIYSVKAFAVHVFCQQGVPEALFFFTGCHSVKKFTNDANHTLRNALFISDMYD